MIILQVLNSYSSLIQIYCITTNIKTQEEKGFFDFVVIKNTGENTPENLDNMKLLTDLKNIIAKQLPKMPKEYIVRLVFDKHHENMIIIQRK